MTMTGKLRMGAVAAILIVGSVANFFQVWFDNPLADAIVLAMTIPTIAGLGLFIGYTIRWDTEDLLLKAVYELSSLYARHSNRWADPAAKDDMVDTLLRVGKLTRQIKGED